MGDFGRDNYQAIAGSLRLVLQNHRLPAADASFQRGMGTPPEGAQRPECYLRTQLKAMLLYQYVPL